MSGTIEVGPFGNPGEESRFPHLTSFDESRQDLYGRLQALMANPVDVSLYAEDTGKLMSAAARNFADLSLEILREADDRESSQSQIVTLIKGDDEERVKKFSEATGDDAFVCMDREYIEEHVAEVFNQSETDTDLSEFFYQLYGSVISSDVEKLINLAQTRYAKRMQLEMESKPSTLTVIGSHALDVAKIAVGATVALWAYKRMGQ